MAMLINGFSDLSFQRAGVFSGNLTCGSLSVHARLDVDVRGLFPYIRATFPKSRYYDRPEFIRFVFDGALVNLFPDEAFAGPFFIQEEALQFLERLIDFLNDLHARKGAIEPSYRKVRQTSAVDIYRLLPQTNCRACGYPTCLAFAAALSRQKTTPGRCPDFERPIAENAVYPVYDQAGNLISTVTLDVGGAAGVDDRRRTLKNTRQSAAGKPEAAGGGEGMKGDNGSGPAIRPLTGREKAVLSLLVQGATNSEISEILKVSPHTVKSHVTHIFNKLNVNDRTQASVLAVRLNLLADG